ncbi:fungal-specific transcription factor domain-containing protein [Ilyonectria robusta]|uniref:fungal-specific transcription factor domain-containing protein n=1 Tax=Ilyonectria robusta TaxID=1079257 RepID=UPI001E8E086B|nr:fungal-specific transcription factor domain-containing protein [Ilyonectria robusta]KAH8673202.1 fungal-specific transcription factor domain-containing protein [Ilyonectria robusta]
MSSVYRIRFAPSSKYQLPASTEANASRAPSASSSTPPSPDESNSPLERTRNRTTKSRLGCRECKLRRVKCDETYPVCLRCQRRGSVCLSSPRPAQWQTEVSWYSDYSLSPWTGDSPPNKRLLQYWLEQSSKMMSVDPNNNPLSFPLLRYLAASPSLVHAVQSVGAGQETFFNSSSLGTCLEERGRALKLVRQELANSARPPLTSLLTVFILGVSTPWLESQPQSYGKEHLNGARAVINLVLSEKGMAEDPLMKFLLGWYIWWDMCCSFIADSDDLSTVDTPKILAILQPNSDAFHPMNGFSSELYTYVASASRYCRRVLDHRGRDPAHEVEIETKLLAWQPDDRHPHLARLSMAYRNHALIMLYNTCPDSGLPMRTITSDDGLEIIEGTEAIVRFYALQTLRNLLSTPMHEACVIFQTMPLLTAAAELKECDVSLRGDVIIRCKALYSICRIAVMLRCIDMLDELWALRDRGVEITWMELSLTKSWRLCFS